MKLFLDTANSVEIERWYATGLIDGVTTNPSHLAQEAKSPRDTIQKICSLVPEGEISVEVTSTKPEDVYKQAQEIAALSENIVVKIPCHRDYYAVIKQLAEEDVPLNVTLIFTLVQGMLMSKLGVRYISPFIGRWDDIDVSGIDLISQMREMLENYGFETEVLAASIRSVRHVHESILAGAHIVTVPLDIMNKMTEHPLTNEGMEKFLSDWKKRGNIQFP